MKVFTKLMFGLLLLMASLATRAQTNIANYKFSRTTGATYTPLTGDSTAFSGTYDNSVSAAIPLGGTFTYGGVAYTTCFISTNGFITFGAASGTAVYTPLSTAASSVLGVVAAYAQDAGGSTVTGASPRISYANVGSEFVVQFQDHSNYFDRASNRMNFQIRLNLSTNAINIIYGSCTLLGTSTSGTTAQVGLRGATTTWTDNVNNLLLPNVPTGTTCNWADAVTGNANSSSLLFAGSNTNINIPTGLTYTWTPGTSPAPVRSFNAVSNITTTGARISWSPATSATQYNVQYRVLGSCSWTDLGAPVTDTIATLSGLTPATVYQVRVQSSGGGSVAIWSHIPSSAAGSGTNGYTTSGTFSTAAQCPIPTGVSAGSVTATSASITFTSTGNSFIVEYGATGFTPGTGATAGTGGTVVTGTASPIALTGLMPSTAYQVYVRQNCTASSNGYSANTAVVSFTTAALCPIPTAVSVGSITSTSASVSFTSTGTSFIVEYGATGFTPGTGATAGTGGTVVTGTASPIVLTGLTSNTAYQVYVRQNCTAASNGFSGNTSSNSFTTLVTPPANDEASGATTLTLGAGCTGAIYTLAGATASTGEPYPSCSGTIYNPVWFKFVAPASGSVRVSTDVGTGNTLTDSKVGLFSATNVANYSTFTIISCDEDGGATSGTTGDYLSVLYATGLTPGITYYVAVDKYTSSTTAGTFCIVVDELTTSMLSTTNSCSSTYQTPFGSNATYTGWVPLLDASSKLIALAQNPAGGNVSSYSVGQNISTGAVRSFNGMYYLDRNFRIANSSATNVNVQMFFLQSELAALQAVDPQISLANIGVTRQTEATTGCSNNYDTSRGVSTFIGQSGNGSANGVNWISFVSPGFSNFYLHRGTSALPITFEYLKGKNAGTGNALNWKVNCTSASVTMVLERSADARKFDYTVTSITASQARCGQPFDATDAAPLKGTNYYRLKMIDVDGKVTYSPVVAILYGKAGAELVGIYPTVVSNEAYLSVTASRTTKMQIAISDMSGKVIRTMTENVVSGSSVLTINTNNIASGVYNITGMLDGVKTQTLRFIKE